MGLNRILKDLSREHLLSPPLPRAWIASCLSSALTLTSVVVHLVKDCHPQSAFNLYVHNIPGNLVYPLWDRYIVTQLDIEG